MRIKSIQRVEKKTLVHDIQTTTHNFFAEGVLVHNCFTEAVLTEPYGGTCPVRCGHSLLAGEQLDTLSGPRSIEELKPGDRVWGRTEKGKELTPITAVTSNWQPSGYWVLTLQDGRRLKLTGEHYVFSTERRWVTTQNLIVGEHLEGIEGNPIIATIQTVPGGVTVYDVQTPTENFYVNGVLVHNCYINAGTRGYRSQGVTTVPIDYKGAVRRMLSKMKTSAAAYLSSFTDPFQLLEEIYHNSQGCAEAFVEAGLPIFFLSRLSYPGWAYDLLKKNPYSYAQKSINTPSPDDWYKMSPGALPLLDHFAEIHSLHQAGIYISIQVNPILAGVTSNDEIVELIHLLAAAGVDHCIFKFAEIAYPNRKSLTELLEKQYGERGRVFTSLFTCNIGHQATIDETYRIDALNRFSRECKKAGVTMSVCYEYRFRRDTAGNIVDRIGVSMGRDYVTSDQCHGHRVPLFSRDTLEEPFREVEACPPSGCLHCSDDNDGKPACGSNFFGSARALEFKDFTVSVSDKKASDLVQITPLSMPRKNLFS